MITTNTPCVPTETSPIKKRIAKVAIALMACAVLLVSAIGLSGCKPPEGQLAANAAVTEVAAIEKHRYDVLKCIPEVVQADQLDKIGISTEEFYDWWLADFKWNMGKMDINLEDTDAEIEATITCRPLEPIIKQWSNDYIGWLLANSKAIKAGIAEDPKEYGRNLLKSMFENTDPTVHECMIQVHKYDEGWSVVPGPENGLFKDALIGSTDNLLGYYQTPLDQLQTLGVPLMLVGSEDEQTE